MLTLRYTPCDGWFGKRTKQSGVRVVWSARLRRPSRLEDLELRNPREEKGMGEWLTPPPPHLHPVLTCHPGERHDCTPPAGEANSRQTWLKMSW